MKGLVGPPGPPGPPGPVGPPGSHSAEDSKRTQPTVVPGVTLILSLLTSCCTFQKSILLKI